VVWECFAQNAEILNCGTASCPCEETREAEAILVHSDTREIVILAQALVDVVLLCFSGLKYVLESVSSRNIESLGSVAEV